MTNQLPASRRRYTTEEIELALQLLAFNAGAYEKTTQLLHQQGIEASKQTLWEWANERHQDRYEEIKTEVHNEVASRIASQAEQIMLQAGELEQDILHRLHHNLDDLKPADLATALRNVTTTKALNNDKISAPIRGRPNHITQDRTAEDIFRALRQLEPGLIIDSTAEDTTELDAGEDQPQRAIG